MDSDFENARSNPLRGIGFFLGVLIGLGLDVACCWLIAQLWGGAN